VPLFALRPNRAASIARAFPQFRPAFIPRKFPALEVQNIVPGAKMPLGRSLETDAASPVAEGGRVKRSATEMVAAGPSLVRKLIRRLNTEALQPQKVGTLNGSGVGG
jgi:hypothetical protein